MRPSAIDTWVLERFPTPVAVAWREVLHAELHPDAHARFHDVLARTFAADRLGFLVPGDMRVQGWVCPRQTAACAAGAEALAALATKWQTSQKLAGSHAAACSSA